MSEATPAAGTPSHGQLSLWDTVSIIVAIVIGSSIFETPPTIFQGVAGPWEGLGVWLFCGFLSFVGALCYAELATTYPRAGGDYVYLTRGFDRPIGFLFGWAQLAVILSASTGAMAFIFGSYGTELLGINAGKEYGMVAEAEKALKVKKDEAKKLVEDAKSSVVKSATWDKRLAIEPALTKEADEAFYATERKKLGEAEAALTARKNEIATTAAQLAVGAVVVITLLNFFGVVLNTWMLNGLVIIKLIGLALIVIAALVSPAAEPFKVTDATRGGGGFSVSLILILYAFGGWNDAAFVAADLKDRRNIPKALLLGTLGVTVIYLLVNFAYILSLSMDTPTVLENGETIPPARYAYPNIASHVLGKAFGPTGSVIISVIVMISALSAMNGLIFTGSRVYMSLGAEHRVFGLLGKWSPTLKAPIWSLIAQALVTVGMILTVGTITGRDAIDRALGQVGIDAIPWGQYFGGFNTLFAGAAPAFWIFFLLTGFSMFALRARDPNIARPFKLSAPWYPILPLIFCGMCLFGFFAAMRYAGWISLLGFVPLFLGLPLYWLSGAVTTPAEPQPVSPAAPESEQTLPLFGNPKDDRFKPSN